MSPVPGDRFASVGEFVAALEGGAPAEYDVVGSPLTGLDDDLDELPDEPSLPVPRRRWVPMGVLGLVVVGGAVATAWVLSSGATTNDAATTPVAPPVVRDSAVRALAWLGVLGCVLGPAADTAAAQAGDSLIVTGMRAYKNLESDAATLLPRRGVVQLTAASAPVARGAKGLVYLGAAELFRGRRDSTVAVFRRLVVLDPRYRPDQLVFPPEVTSVFEAVRLRTKTVAIEIGRAHV